MPTRPRLFDISIPIQPGMPQWPGDDPVAERPLSRTPEDVANVTDNLGLVSRPYLSGKADGHRPFLALQKHRHWRPGAEVDYPTQFSF